MKQGQVTLESPFGKVLTELAKAAHNILEIGAWNGCGSTQCLLRGLRQRGKLMSVEADPKMHEEARTNLLPHIDAYRVTLMQAVASRQILPFAHPDSNPQIMEMWIQEMQLSGSMPLLTHTQEWPQFLGVTGGIDLLLLDGGEFTSLGDFLTLWPWARIIALDDTNPKKSVKNWFARDCLIRAGWHVLWDHQDDRNGWFVARRVK